VGKGPVNYSSTQLGLNLVVMNNRKKNKLKKCGINFNLCEMLLYMQYLVLQYRNF